jgi:hypothetical protein
MYCFVLASYFDYGTVINLEEQAVILLTPLEGTFGIRNFLDLPMKMILGIMYFITPQTKELRLLHFISILDTMHVILKATHLSFIQKAVLVSDVES